jgi:GNAT acetyltransferase-like protein
MAYHEFSAVPTDEWNRFAASSPDAWLFHLAQWIQLETSAARSVSFLVTSGDEPVAICPLFVSRRKYAGMFPLNVLHTGGARSGPALAPNLSTRRSRDILQEVFWRIDELARTHRIDKVELRLPPLAPSYLPPLRQHHNPISMCRPFEPLTYGHSLRKGPAITQIVSLQRPSDVLWSDLDKDCRSAVRKAQQSGVTVTVAKSVDMLAEFRNLQAATYRRTGAAIPPPQFLDGVWSAFHPSGQVDLMMAEHKGIRIAGAVILKYKDAATYWAGASLAEFQHLRPSNLLIWEAISCARQNGLGWFEVGPTFPFADRHSKLRTIGMFKEQFGGNPYALHEGSFSYHPVKTGVVDLLHGIAAQSSVRIRSGWRKGAAE